MDSYTRVRVLGKGSFGAAWLVQRNSDKVLFVAKEIRIADLKPEDMRSALNEVAILRTLDHPNVVHYVDHFECDGTIFLIMEYASGGDLHVTIKSRRGVLFSESEVLHYFAQVCLAIAHLHERRILHRDLKTHNIFLTQDGVVKLGDFGISTVLRSTFELRKTVCGTPYYFSPELCLNRPYNNKSDVWALGCTLYELLTLKHAFEGTSFQTLAQKILKGSYPPIDAGYSTQLSRLVSQMLQTDPHRRPNVSQIIALPFIQEALTRLQRGVQRAAATTGAAMAAPARSPLLATPSPPSRCTGAHAHAPVVHHLSPPVDARAAEGPLSNVLPSSEARVGGYDASAACREFVHLSPYSSMTLEEFRQLDANSQQLVLRGLRAGRARRDCKQSHLEQQLEAARRFGGLPGEHVYPHKPPPPSSSSSIPPDSAAVVVPKSEERCGAAGDKERGAHVARVGGGALHAVHQQLYRQSRQEMQANRQRGSGAVVNRLISALPASPMPTASASASTAAAAAAPSASVSAGSRAVPHKMTSQELEEARLQAYRQMQHEANENKRRLMLQCGGAAGVAHRNGTISSHAPAPTHTAPPSPPSLAHAHASSSSSSSSSCSSLSASSAVRSHGSCNDDTHQSFVQTDTAAQQTVSSHDNDIQHSNPIASSPLRVAQADEHACAKAVTPPGESEQTTESVVPRARATRGKKGAVRAKGGGSGTDRQHAEYDALNGIIKTALHSCGVHRDDDAAMEKGSECASAVRSVNEDGEETDEASPTRFVLDGKTLHLPRVNARHPLMYRIETLRVFLEANMGEEAMLSCYKAMHRISVQDDAARQTVAQSLPHSLRRFVPLMAQLITCEEKFNRQSRLR